MQPILSFNSCRNILNTEPSQQKSNRETPEHRMNKVQSHHSTQKFNFKFEARK